MTGRERIDRCLAGEVLDRPPVTPILMAWAAEQIGRSYRDYYLDWQVLAESQMRAAEALGMDQVSSISDPWREADAFGTELDYPPNGVGIPRRHLLADGMDADRLPTLRPQDGSRTNDRILAVRELVRRSEGRHSVLGWVEGVFAELVDLRGLEDALMDIMDDPECAKPVQEKLLAFALEFAEAQIAEGADMIGTGDAAASLLSPATYEQVVLPYQQRLVDGIHAMGARVKLHICGNTTPLISLMAQSGADVIDVDWMVDLGQAKASLQPGQVIAGNFDPSSKLRFADRATVEAAAAQCLAEAGPDHFILQPGCEVPPGTALENVLAFCPGASVQAEAGRPVQ